MGKRHDVLAADTEPVYLNYKEPLEAVSEGFGYYGVLATDESQTYTQCHLCGQFYYHLGAHVWQVHKLKAKDYKHKFGLYLRRSLLAPKARTDYIERFLKLPEASQEAQAAHLAEARARKAELIASGELEADKTDNPANPLERRNLEGRCADQLIDKIHQLHEAIGTTPTLKEFINTYGGYRSSIVSMFGTWSEAVKQAGLTPRTQLRGMTREQCIERIGVFSRINDRPPRYSDFVNSDILPTTRQIRRHFGGMKQARASAGLDIGE